MIALRKFYGLNTGSLNSFSPPGPKVSSSSSLSLKRGQETLSHWERGSLNLRLLKSISLPRQTFSLDFFPALFALVRNGV